MNLRHKDMDDPGLEKGSTDSQQSPSKLSLWFSQWWHQPPNIWYRRRLLIVLLIVISTLSLVKQPLDDLIPPEAARRFKASLAPLASMDSSIPSTNMPSVPDPWLLETAALIGQFYELFIKMRYLPATSIAYPPHTSPSINTRLAHSLGLTTQAIEFLQLLPYVTGRTAWGGGGEQEFLFSGIFADFRDDDTLEQSRDPLYGSPDPDGDWEDENGPYMRPWYVAVNQLGNHGTVMVLDLKTRRLWMEDQEGGWTSDPGLRDIGEYRQVSENRNAFENVPSRRVDVVLKDLMRKFEEVEWVPGGFYPGTGDLTADVYKSLYLEHGWPDNFNGSGFHVARLAFEDAKSERYSAEQPFREVSTYRGWLKGSQEKIARLEALGGAEREKYEEVLRIRVPGMKTIEEEIESIKTNNVRLEAELRGAEEVVRNLDPAIGKARKEFKAKYPMEYWDPFGMSDEELGFV